MVIRINIDKVCNLWKIDRRPWLFLVAAGWLWGVRRVGKVWSCLLCDYYYPNSKSKVSFNIQKPSGEINIVPYFPISFTAFPDVEIREITEDWEFLILACDGIWDVLSNDAVVDFCRQRIAMGELGKFVATR